MNSFVKAFTILLLIQFSFSETNFLNENSSIQATVFQVTTLNSVTFGDFILDSQTNQHAFYTHTNLDTRNLTDQELLTFKLKKSTSQLNLTPNKGLVATLTSDGTNQNQYNSYFLFQNSLTSQDTTLANHGQASNNGYSFALTPKGEVIYSPQFFKNSATGNLLVKISTNKYNNINYLTDKDGRPIYLYSIDTLLNKIQNQDFSKKFNLIEITLAAGEKIFDASGNYNRSLATKFALGMNIPKYPFTFVLKLR